MIHLTPQLTIDRARTLSLVIDRAGESVESGADASDPRGGTRQIVVELREDIEADDYSQHDAFILKLDGGEWIDAEQKPVKVTKISEGAISASEDAPIRCIARTVATFGWCIDPSSSTSQKWGMLTQASGRDDRLLTVTLYETAIDAEFSLFECGPCATESSGSGSSGSGSSGSGSGSGSGCDNNFIEMEISLCGEIGPVVALVPAGYKAGPVLLVKTPLCGNEGSGSGSSGSGSGSGYMPTWDGWTVVAGRRERCVMEVPNKVECCPIEGLKITEWKRKWFFGGELPDRFDPCTTGSGSGS